MSAPAAADPVIIGVRHHSPACARVVAETIRALRPAHVLIEGPADMNPRMGELLLGHTPPLAIFSYLSGPVSDDETMHHAAYTPFAQCSPEWQAIQLGAEQGAAVRFIDLPAWHPDMAEIADRYAASEQARENSERYLDALAAELGTDSFDTTWDRLFEDTAHLPVTELAERLRVHFEQLRADDAGSASNQAREQMMASWIAWAVRRGEGPVVVVCGGYHAPALARRWRELDGSLPEVAEPASLGSELRHGSFLVPYTHKQLDAMAGYGAGMSSPGYYDDVWREGAERAGVKLVRGVLGRLRAKKQQASTADFIAIVTKARALAQVRGHHSTLRNDWLDAIAGALVRDALTVPLPWSYRGLLRPGTDPILVEVVDVLGGNAAGRLAEGTPQPPLVADVAETLDRLAIPQLGRLQLDLFDAADLARSHALHQLAILGIPGVERVSGPSSATSGERAEVWSLRRDRHRDAALIEAGSYGATLEGAAGARLAAQIAESSGAVAALAGLLNAAAQAGLSQLQGDLLPRLREGIGAEPKLEELGLALGILYPLRRHADWLALASSPVLTETIDAAIDRALWLLEPASVIAPADTSDHLRTMLVLRDIARDHAVADPDDPLVARMLGILERKAADDSSAPLSRGAALGALLSLAIVLPGDAQPSALGDAISLLGGLAAAEIGEALGGLLALAREQLSTSAAFLQGVDGLINALSPDDFLRALPGLRDGFAWLPSRERGEVAARLARLLGLPSAGALKSRLAVSPTDAARLMAAEASALAELGRWGLAEVRP